MIDFRDPELLLLAVPAMWAFWRWGRAAGVTGWIRGLLLVCLVVALAGPRLHLGGRGLDLFVLVDRSRSMPEPARENIRELIRNLDEARGPGDHVGIVTFGADTRIERPPSRTDSFNGYAMEILPDGSDVHEAIERTLALAKPNRPTRLLVLSDGQSNGPDPSSAARHARELGIPIDVRLFPREVGEDIAVDRFDLPAEVAPREAFSFSVTIDADREIATTLTLSRDGKELETRDVHLEPGRTRLRFVDRIDTPGFVTYAARLGHADSRPENNRGVGALRVTAGPRILLLNREGRPGHLARALRSGRLAVDVASARAHPLTQDTLDPYRAVILENVPADDLRRQKMERLARFVEDLGGGLLMTGGRRSFAVGGYRNSPLDSLMPVSLDLEDDRHKRAAIAIALDRSGSMAVPVNDDLVKMDLANRGAVEAIRLLSSDDEAAILAVDTQAHVIVPLSTSIDQEAISRQIRSIQSAEGGIHIEEALIAAGEELKRADQDINRHIILFADAADSERPGNYRELLRDYQAQGITVSVIGLGMPTDQDAGLLREIAALGHGKIAFTSDAEELPRIFTQQAMNVVRNTFLVAPNGGTIGGRLVEDARLMGYLREAPLPDARGYNLTRLKPQATLAASSLDEETAPWSAFWYRGLGRVAAVTFEADGEFTGPMARWEGYDAFFQTHLRWLLGEGDLPGVYIDAERRRLDAVIDIELDPGRPQREALPRLTVIPPGSSETEPITPELTWTGAHTLTARVRLLRNGSYRTLVRFGERAMKRGPTITLPYSPEFMTRRDAPSGGELLGRIATLSGGLRRTNVLAALSDPPPSRGSTSLLPVLLAIGSGLLVVEIAGRRLALWPKSRGARSADESVDSEVDSSRPFRKRFRRRRGAAAPAEPPTDPAASRLDEIYTRAKHRVRR